MLTVSDLLGINHISSMQDISLKLYKEFFDDILCKRIFLYELEDGKKIKLVFQQNNLLHILGAQHILGNKYKASKFNTEIINGNMTFEELEKKNGIVFNDYTSRFLNFSNLYHVITNCDMVYFDKDTYNKNRKSNEESLMDFSYILYEDINNKKDFYDLINTIEILRGEDGCAWDREQTHESIKNSLIEEAYETVEAIEDDNIDGLIEELGDVLLQVVFHSVIGKEDGYFNISDVIEAITTKMIYRHPHVFGNVVADSSKEVLENWDELKKKEKNYETLTEEIEGIAKTLPALTKAHKVQKKVSKVGFDFEDVNEAVKKIEEEINEVLDVYKSNNMEKIINEVGDLLFACVNVARLLNVDEEEALNKSIKKFVKRFKFVEENLLKQDKNLNDSTLDEMNALWEDSKKYD